MNRLELLATVRAYLERNDIEGLREWIIKTEAELRRAIEEARARRMRSLNRAIRPVSRGDGLVCFDEADLYWLFSRTSLKRMGLD